MYKTWSFAAILLAAEVIRAGDPPVLQGRDFRIDDKTYTMRIASGYELELLAAGLRQPRLMVFDRAGNLIIGSKSGNLYKVSPPYREPVVLLQLNDYPHSAAIAGDWLYIAQSGSVTRIHYTPDTTQLDRDKLQVVAKLPAGGGHNSRTIQAGPDGQLYISLGISGNCSDEYLDESYPFSRRRGGLFVLRLAHNPPLLFPYASGLRNPVGFGWHPVTGVLYATNNGPDHHGYHQPPEYFAEVTEGSFHGMPWYQYDGNALHRDDCIGSTPPLGIKEVKQPVALFPSRSAPLGMGFVPMDCRDESLRGSAIVALHGSWGTLPSGDFMGDPASRREPKLVTVIFRDGRPTQVHDMITGFQAANGDRWARPAGVIVGKDGIYFTSDAGINGLYRMKYTGQ